MTSTQDALRQTASGAETCQCGDCAWFCAHRKQLFPFSFTSILTSLGVDLAKDIEVASVVLDEQAQQTTFMGWFHAHGKVLAGPDNFLPLSLDAVMPHSVDFEYRLSNREALAAANFPRPILQIDFHTTVRTNGETLRPHENA